MLSLFSVRRRVNHRRHNTNQFDRERSGHRSSTGQGNADRLHACVLINGCRLRQNRRAPPHKKIGNKSKSGPVVRVTVR